MTIYHAISTATCSPDKVGSSFNMLVNHYITSNPDKTINTIQHSTCSIGSPMSPYILISVQFTATGA
ncbi:hypothetical protein [Hymenobacter metallicola]|uniref:Uncharacterized protein n=1 Tax=Hymenobacter metallicola TaxID=2563114 RepID=A0A4Z0PZZ9_9BACT|nr:hypothetical protein [Hymenobacter metallicola]TGE22816.1 hypothetical protein E5K02_20845 [Hymenobacter metallicola]